MKLIMENFRNFRKMVNEEVAEEDKLLPRWKRKRPADPKEEWDQREWIERQEVLTACGGTCDIMFKEPGWQEKMECVANCPRNPATPPVDSAT